MRIRPASAFAAVLVIWTCFIGTAAAQEACPSNMDAVAVGASLTCRCSSDQLLGGGIYGTARYSADSSVCKAAKHAGAMPDGGGVVTVHAVEGCPTFVGSTANGITTSNWGGAIPKTFSFANPAPECGLSAFADASKPGGAPASVASTPGLPDCPRTVNAAGLASGKSLNCNCTAEVLRVSGAVYGTDRYSGDSPICLAARHAGKVDANGGAITVYAADTCGRFDGVERNGVSSRAWGSSVPLTFAFALPDPACAAAAPVASGPAAGSPMAGWQARARTYAAALPEAQAGWTANEREILVENSSVTGRNVAGYRIYRLGQNPANLDSILINISNNPDGSTGYPIENWREEAKRNAAGMKMVKVGGRDAMEGKSGDITTIWFLLSNNLFVSLVWQEKHVTREQVDAYIKALDFAKIEALAAK